ncbi:phage head closure protein [Pseudomonas sp. 148P]|uniref:Phage head closure protein n=2 Tax=Pseudomonas TaxID=286 RepID=A0ABU7HQ35_9PSED|nr:MULTISPECIES: phage head closure protein [unclassified Pseudomonas]MEE1922679.1 phage head closure protein [Pseudomonas sp. 147P]MEE1933656.1 phage head closure protein [Pseudomonas sp. 148P]
MRRGFVEGKDALGQPSKVWGDLGPIWAEINIPSGRMYEAASQMQVQVSAEINIRYRKDVVAGQHLVHQGITYEIIAPLPTNQRDMLKLMCKTVKS